MEFYIRSILLGFALAMDACAVSMVNGMNDTKMKYYKVIFVAFLFGLFQALMPLAGYLVGHLFISIIEPFIPWIALILLTIIGGKMLYEGIKHKEDCCDKKIQKLTIGALIIQAIATSIDALSAGLTFANYTLTEAIICVLIIMLITFIVCLISVYIGKKFGACLGNKAEILGGVILILIGLEIFITGII